LLKARIKIDIRFDSGAHLIKKGVIYSHQTAHIPFKVYKGKKEELSKIKKNYLRYRMSLGEDKDIPPGEK
jgi:hypothetical protein